MCIYSQDNAAPHPARRPWYKLPKYATYEPKRLKTRTFIYSLHNAENITQCKFYKFCKDYHAFFHCTKYLGIGETDLFSWYNRNRDLVSFYSDKFKSVPI